MVATMSDIVGKPVLIDKLKPELGSKVAKWIHEDNQRAEKARRDKKAKQKPPAKDEPAASE